MWLATTSRVSDNFNEEEQTVFDALDMGADHLYTLAENPTAKPISEDDLFVIEVFHKGFDELKDSNHWVLLARGQQQALSRVVGTYEASLGKWWPVTPDLLRGVEFVWPSQQNQLKAVLKAHSEGG